MSAIIRVAQVMGKMAGGGVEAVVMNYYKYIDKNKVQFDFIVDSDSTNIPKEEIESMGGRVIIVPPYQRLNKYIPALIKLFKTEKYKIVHSHINTLSIFPLFAAKQAGIPVRIAHNHSTAGKGELKKNTLKYVLRPFSKLMPNYYFACSEYAGKWLFGKNAFKKNNAKIINNAINLDKFLYNKEIRERKRKELKLESKFVVGHVGRFTYQKNHRFLIDIFNEIHKQDNNAILMLIGTGELEEEIKQKVKNLNLSEYVRFMGQRNDVNEMMQVMDVFVLPSFYEGLPVVGIEAQATGMPCVVSAAVTKEVEVTNKVEFIDLCNDANFWAKKILEKKSFKRNNAENELTKNGYNIKIEANKLAEYYNDYFYVNS